jgi:hypothetical protein
MNKSLLNWWNFIWLLNWDRDRDCLP